MDKLITCTDSDRFPTISCDMLTSICCFATNSIKIYPLVALDSYTYGSQFNVLIVEYAFKTASKQENICDLMCFIVR